MKHFKTAVIVLCILLICLFIGMLFIRIDIKEESMSLNMSYEITDKLGFNNDVDALYFGKGYPGTVTKRFLFVSNMHDYPVVITIKVEGDISPFISVSENEFRMEKNSSKTITYYAQTPSDTPYGNYTGLTILLFKKI